MPLLHNHSKTVLKKRHQRCGERNHEKGSAIIMIFVAVALFGALSFTVAEIMRSGDPETIGREQAKLKADQILDYARTVRQGVQAVRISNGCADTDISFTVTGSDGYEHTPATPDTCKIFHSSGGGLTSVTTGPDDKTWIFRSQAEIYNVGTNCAGANCTELFIMIPVQTDMICDAINKKLGLPEDINGGTFPADMVAAANFTGTYAYSTTLGDATVTAVRSAAAACIDHSTSTQDSLFYQVLIPR